MTPYMFDSLAKAQQADVLQYDSNYLYTRQEPEFIIDLYQVADFYVEVYFHNSEEEFVGIRSFYIGNQQEVYLPDYKIRYITNYGFSMPSA
jgi:hypothetical protein